MMRSSLVAASVGTGVAIVASVALDLFAIMYARSFERASRAQRTAIGGAAPPARAPATMSRREFFRRSLLTSLLVFGAEFGGASLAFI